MAKVNFYSITPTQYSSLSNKDNDALYFLTNGEIYKGDMLLSNNVVLISDGEDYPTTGEDNKIYAKASGESAFWNGSSYTLISRSIMSELESLENRVNETIRLTINPIGYIDRTITHIENSNITNVGNHAFRSCTSLESVNLPNVTNVGSYVFSGCARLTTVNLPNVTNVGSYAFSGCTSLESVNFPNVTNVGNYAFRSCTSLESVNLPNVTNVYSYAFQNCTSLTTINFPNVTNVYDYAFENCTSLTTINLPNVTSIGDIAFENCTSLTTINLPNVTSIGDNAFKNCNNLTKIIIGTDISGTCTLDNSDAFNNTPIASGTGYIYVPDNLVNNYKAASNWSTYSAQIKSINELHNN